MMQISIYQTSLICIEM